MKIFKGILGILWVVLLSFSLFSSAQAEKRLKANLEGGYQSRYINLSGQAIYDHSGFQQLTIADRSGIYLKFSGINDDGDEQKYTLGFSKLIGGIDIDTGYSFRENTDNGDLHSPYLNLSKNFSGIKGYLLLRQDIPVDETGCKDSKTHVFKCGVHRPPPRPGQFPFPRHKVEQDTDSGFMYRLGVEWPFDRLPLPLKLNLSVGGHDGVRNAESTILGYANLGVSTTFKAWKIEIIPSVNFQTRLDNGRGKIYEGVSGGVKVSIPLF